MPDLDLFKEILCIDSTSGKERELALFLKGRLHSGESELLEVGDGTLNLRLKWGNPRMYFCTHMDTVPPYIPPHFYEDKVTGRGSCDAKGQLFAMYSACMALEQKGLDGFGLLLLAGEETGSHGAKAYARQNETADLVIVGEPTDNKMITHSKGTKAFEINIKGKSCHSGYPHLGISAVDLFVDLINKIRAAGFPDDPVLGKTTFNIGKLHSDNPQNILSDSLTCRIYFRTTAAGDKMVSDLMKELTSEAISINPLGGDDPMEYFVFDGFDKGVVSFGSDAPRLTNFKKRALFGPGSITVAHTPDEYVMIKDLEQAKEHYETMALKYLSI